MRGEHAAELMSTTLKQGSSPHARGTLRCRHRAAAALGIIPACAGNTEVAGVVQFGGGDHPRMRGEHFGSGCWMPSGSGSSPHARGTHIRSCYPLFDAGIIPACAGNTRPANTRTARPWDHPRMRGEHAVSILASRIEWGSSPHARGTPTGCCHADGPPRDHPRMRGEHPTLPAVHVKHRGSSPHARGTLARNRQRNAANGIIPACAGNTGLRCYRIH